MTAQASAAPAAHRERFVPTLVYAREALDFHTRLCIYNYFSELFPKEQTGATAYLSFYDRDGRQVAERAVEIPFRGQLQFDLSELGIKFEGMAGVALVPETMPSLSHNWPMATSYYVFYSNDKGNADFGHEWEPAKYRPSHSGSWMQVVRPLDDSATEVIVMSAYFGDDPEVGRAEWTMGLRNGQGRLLGQRQMPAIPPRGSARVALGEVFPEIRTLAEREGTIAVEVAGSNIQGPLTCVRAPSGDFNIHHF